MFYVYLAASRQNGTLYAGSTDDIRKRIEEHRAKRFDGFTARYGVTRLVGSRAIPRESRPSAASARSRRVAVARKLQLIEARNPNWVDLYDDLDRWLMEDDLRLLPLPRTGEFPHPYLAHPGASRDPDKEAVEEARLSAPSRRGQPGKWSALGP